MDPNENDDTLQALYGELTPEAFDLVQCHDPLWLAQQVVTDLDDISILTLISKLEREEDQ